MGQLKSSGICLHHGCVLRRALSEIRASKRNYDADQGITPKHWECKRDMKQLRKLNQMKDKFSILCIAALSYFIVGHIPTAQAEGATGLGNGAQGANRRVRTENGFVGVRGTFTEPTDFSLPARYDNNGNYINGSNVEESKPSFYIGSGSGDIEIDAGIQWEYDTAFGQQRGWVALISWSHAPDSNGDGRPDRYTNPRVGNNPWRVPRGSLGSVTLTSTVQNNGASRLQVATTAPAASNAQNFNFDFYWDADHTDDGSNPNTEVFPTLNQTITNAAVSGMNVKRVVAMTQRGQATRDGSFVRSVEFAAGDIAQPVWDANGNLTLNWLGGWPMDNVDQGETGYAPGTQDGQGRWVVDFDFAGMNVPDVRGAASTNDPQGTYRDAVVAARYPAETVHIHLRRGPARAAGRPVRRGGN